MTDTHLSHWGIASSVTNGSPPFQCATFKPSRPGRERRLAPPAHTKLRIAYDLKARIDDVVSKEPRPPHQDPILLAIDVGMFGHNGSINEIGAAYMDSRYFHDACLSQKHPIIKTYHYFVHYVHPENYADESLTAMLEPRRREETKAIRRARLDFTRRDSAFVHKSQLGQLLQHIFYQQSCSEGPQSFRLIRAETMKNRLRPSAEQCRPVILIGHGIDGDLRALNSAGFVPQVPLRCVDTWKVADCLFPNVRNERHKSPLTLRGLCIRLGISPRRLHVSGRDALYSMVAALKMAAIIYQAEQSEEGFTTATQLLNATKSTSPSIEWY